MGDIPEQGHPYMIGVPGDFKLHDGKYHSAAQAILLRSMAEYTRVVKCYLEEEGLIEISEKLKEVSNKTQDFIIDGNRYCR